MSVFCVQWINNSADTTIMCRTEIFSNRQRAEEFADIVRKEIYNYEGKDPVKIIEYKIDRPGLSDINFIINK